MRACTVSGFMELLFAVTMLPAAEKVSSEGTVEASMARWSRARTARLGNLVWLQAHHLSGSSSAWMEKMVTYSASSGNPFVTVSREEGAACVWGAKVSKKLFGFGGSFGWWAIAGGQAEAAAS